MNQSIPVQDIDELINNLPQMVKSHPYIKYSKYPEVVKKVIDILKHHRKGDIPKVGCTLYNWEKPYAKIQTPTV